MLSEESRIKIAVLVSGGGTNLQALIDAQTAGDLRSGKLSLVLSNNPEAYALKRAAANDIPVKVVTVGDSKTTFEENLLKVLSQYGIEMIVLAGFMTILSENFIRTFGGPILNVHPSLIPAFCGKGMYGLHVHEAALARGVKVTGATVHFVNEIPDGGEIILQKAVTVCKSDTPEILQKRVMKNAEWVILPKATEMVSRELFLKKKGVLPQ